MQRLPRPFRRSGGGALAVLALVCAVPAAASPGGAGEECSAAAALGARLAQASGPAAALPRARRAWLEAAATLERCSDAFPDDPRAAAAGLALARLTAELHRQSRLRADLDLAAVRYAAVAARWRDRPEAARARLGLAELKLEFGSVAEALELYRRLAALKGQPGADEVSRRAARALAILGGLGPGDAPPAGDGAPGTAPAPTVSASAPAPAAGPGGGAQAGVIPGATPGAVVASHIVSIAVKRTPSAARVVIGTDRPVGYTHGEVPAMAGRPARVFVDLPGATIATGVNRTRSFPQGKLLLGLRAAPFRADQARVVVELAAGVRAQVYAIERPPAVVVEARRAEDMARPKELRPQGGLTLSEAAAIPIRRVVVDAGHGGTESGAVGQGGLLEKEVTLDVARRLEPLLQRQGLEVILTRTDDQTVPLEGRTKRANDARADLFISVHVNAAPDKRRDGVETYFLDLADDAYARRLAQRENQGSGRSMADLQLLVADLMTRAHTEDSALLAKSVEQMLQRALHKGSGKVKGVRKALFYVLIGAKMPSILCELSFISNAKAEREMREPRFRERAAQGIADGVAAFIAARRKRIEGGGDTVPARAAR
jgi:N-acetylmuramoyl-L-alanine amidase